MQVEEELDINAETRGRHSAVPRCNNNVQQAIRLSLDTASKRRPLAADLAINNVRILEAAMPQLAGAERARARRTLAQLKTEAEVLRHWGVRV